MFKGKFEGNQRDRKIGQETEGERQWWTKNAVAGAIHDDLCAISLRGSCNIFRRVVGGLALGALRLRRSSDWLACRFLWIRCFAFALLFLSLRDLLHLRRRDLFLCNDYRIVPMTTFLLVCALGATTMCYSSLLHKAIAIELPA